MKRRHIFSLLLASTVLLASGCSQPLKPFDIKGVWEATGGQCWDVCQFTVRDKVDSEQPGKLFITFLNWKGGGNGDHVFTPTTTPGKEGEWTFLHKYGTGYLYLEGHEFKAISGITYQKINEATK